MIPAGPDEDPTPDPDRRAAGFRLLWAFLGSVALSALVLTLNAWLTGGDPLGQSRFIVFFSLILGFAAWPLLAALVEAWTRGEGLRAALYLVLAGLFVWLTQRTEFGPYVVPLAWMFVGLRIAFAAVRPALVRLFVWVTREADSNARLLFFLWVFFGLGLAMAVWRGLGPD